MAGAAKSSAELNPLLRRILEGRGIAAADLEAFLNPSLDDLMSPDQLPGVVEAADIVLAAIVAHRQIVVFGDYDCDGVCATAILLKVLTALGASVEAFIPKRLEEGYGMSDTAVARMLREYPEVGLLVTVDNGINSLTQIAALKAKGVGVVVTDHHLPTSETDADGRQKLVLPAADALINPKVASAPGFENLCGAGVAFLLANRLVAEAKRRGLYAGGPLGGPLLVLAGLATVTDIMALTGQNRILVAEALSRFRNWAPIGLRELYLKAARTGVEEMSSRDFGFMIGPRINAAGRLASGMEALELLVSEDREIVRELARIIDGYNVERKSIEQTMTEQALSKVVVGASAQVIDLPDGHPGVAGIVAARVLERLDAKCPVCVLAGGHGSARSPSGINIREAFVACAEVLNAFGGHAAAGGFAVKDGQVDEFRRRLCEYCDALPAAVAVADAGTPVDAWVEPGDLTLELAEQLQWLAPFGEGNPEPVFGLRKVPLSDVRPLGSDGRHLSLTLKSGLRAIQWNHGDRVESLRAAGAEPHDLKFTLTVSDYGERHVELRLVSGDGVV